MRSQVGMLRKASDLIALHGSDRVFCTHAGLRRGMIELRTDRMSDLAKLRIWDDPAIHGALS
jgi:hypothetical protein